VLSISWLIRAWLQVGYASNSSIPFLTTGGGHAFSIDLASLQNGIEIDLSNFNNVSVDATANTLTIGGAVRFRDVVGPLGQARKELREYYRSSWNIIN
jgi:FAD/FMN-containing dehydrogenase